MLEGCVHVIGEHGGAASQPLARLPRRHRYSHVETGLEVCSRSVHHVVHAARLTHPSEIGNFVAAHHPGAPS